MHMEMPTPQDEHRKLEALAGTWTGEEKMYPSPWDPKGGTATARITSRIDLDGFFLISDYVQERGGKVTYRGHGVIGWDPQQKRYTMHWFDSFGTPVHEPARGRLEGSTLTFEQTGPMGQHRYIYDLDGKERYSFRIEHLHDNTWSPFMEGRYFRK